MESGRPLISTTMVGVSVCNDRLNQFLLHAGQIQARHVVPLPIGGAIMLPLADYQNGGVGSVGGAHGVGKPALLGAGYFAAAHMRDLGLRRDHGSNSLDYGGYVLEDFLRRIVAQLVHHVIRIGADHRHRFQILLERQQVLIVFQQHDPFATGSQGQILVGL